LKHIFAIGDCAESGAIQAGHTAHWQAEVAARNILRLIERREGRGKGRSKSAASAGTVAAQGTSGVVVSGEEELEAYKPGLPSIKISLGLVSDL
jgi:NADH dehydrogenase FAD-containing subunit